MKKSFILMAMLLCITSMAMADENNFEAGVYHNDTEHSAKKDHDTEHSEKKQSKVLLKQPHIISYRNIYVGTTGDRTPVSP